MQDHSNQTLCFQTLVRTVPAYRRRRSASRDRTKVGQGLLGRTVVGRIHQKIKNGKAAESSDPIGR